ncbi:EAL domain-containing protein [Mycoplasmatota bacterium WC44]
MKKSIVFMITLLLLCSGCVPKEQHNGYQYRNGTVKVEELDSVLLSNLVFDYTNLDLTIEELKIIEKYQNEEIYASTSEWGYYYHDVNVDGIEYKVGIDHYVFQQLKKVFGINLIVKEYDYFEDVMDSIYNGDTHFTAGIYYDETRASQGIYSDFYIKEQIFVYSKNNVVINNHNDFSGLTAGKVKGSVFFNDYKEILNEDNIFYDENEFDTLDELYNALELGEIDFVVLPYNDELIKRGFKNTDISNMINLAVGKITKSHLFGRKNDRDLEVLFTAFNKAFDYGIKENISSYQSNYQSALLLNGEYFTDKEKEFIERTKNEPIILKLNPEIIPYSYYDVNNKKWAGQAIDIFDAIAKITGIEYEIINEPNYLWTSILDELGKDGHKISIDGTLGLAVSDNRREFLEFTNSTYISRIVVVGKSTADDILYLTDLYNYRVGTVPGFYSNDLLFENLKDLDTIKYENGNQMVDAIKNNEIDYFITFDSKFNKLYYDKQEYSLAIKHVTTENVFFANGFSNDDGDGALMVNIYNKILPLVNVSEINDKHFGNKIDLSQVIDKSVLVSNVAISISLTLLVSFIVAWIFMLRFKKQSLIDGLTGLKNRNALNKLMNKVFLYNKSVMFIDVDNFKTINNLYGHSAGDFILKEISYKLSSLNNIGELYRLGGDEFLLVSPELIDTDIEKIHNALNCAVSYGDTVVNVHSTSAVVQSDDFNELGFEDLLNLLSYSVRSGKRNGKNLMVKANDEILEGYKGNKYLESKIQSAVINKEFIPYFQPYINVQTKKVVGAEVLARWVHNDKVYSPAVFHELAEESGIIYDIDLIMFEENLKLLSDLMKDNLVSERFEVTSNFSPYTLGRLDVDQLEKLLIIYGISKDNIGLEVTEQLLLDESGFDKVKELVNRGFNIAIDDFSAGHSSLVYLMDINVKYLKMDKSLLSKVDSNEKTNENYIVYEAISKLSEKLGIVVISEGVETVEQENVLMGLNIEYAQGYLYSKPICKEDFIKLVEKDA